MSAILLSTGLAACLAAMSLGGGLYEQGVVDPAWPSNPRLIQPGRGGIDRKRFWIAIHSAFELTLLVALVLAWSEPAVRAALLAALASHLALRVWSFADFIPKALAFERADPGAVEPAAARAWTRRSLGRLPLALATMLACLAAFALGAA